MDGEVDRGGDRGGGGGGDGGDGFTIKFNCKHKNVSKTFSKPPVFTQH